jgi:hypothetical protein
MQEQKIKEKINGKTTSLTETDPCCSDTCCTPTEDLHGNNPMSSSCSCSTGSLTNIGYDSKELESIPEASILGVG